MTKIDSQLFEHAHASQAAYGECPKCAANLQVKHKGKSSFLGCSNYPACDFVESLTKAEVTTIKIIEQSECPHCQHELAIKNGRFGMFIACTNFPQCDYISTSKAMSAKEDYQALACPLCHHGSLQKRQNKTGKHFYACDAYPKCKFALAKQPLNQACPQCDFPICIEEKDDKHLKCANKACAHEFTRE